MLRPDFRTDLMRMSELLAAQENPSSGHRRDDFEDLAALGSKLERATQEVRGRASRALSGHFSTFPQSPLGAVISLFDVSGFHREEVAHTRTLAWLLDPNKPHGFGAALIEAFLELACGKAEEINQALFAQMDLRSFLQVEAEYRLAQGRRVDIYAQGRTRSHRPWHMLVEAKVDADEGHRQLCDYRKAMRTQNTVLIYLTVEGRLPKDHKDVGHWLPMSFAEITTSFLAVAPKLVAAPGYQLLSMYLVTMLQEFCGVIGLHHRL